IGIRSQNYWKNQFKDFRRSVTLPADFERKEISKGEGDSISFGFTPSTIATLKEIQNEEGVSQFMLCYALVALLLHRYTAEEDITIGSPIAGRDHRAFEEQIGLFLNTLPL